MTGEKHEKESRRVRGWENARVRETERVCYRGLLLHFEMEYKDVPSSPSAFFFVRSFSTSISLYFYTPGAVHLFLG